MVSKGLFRFNNSHKAKQDLLNSLSVPAISSLSFSSGMRHYGSHQILKQQNSVNLTHHPNYSQVAPQNIVGFRGLIARLKRKQRGIEWSVGRCQGC